MTITKNKLTWASTALLACCAYAATAGVDYTGVVPTLRGDRAPIPPLSVIPGPNGSVPFAFADFPDLPGYLPPPQREKEEEKESEKFPIGNGVDQFGDPKVIPKPNTETVSMPFRPLWDNGLSDLTDGIHDGSSRINLNDTMIGSGDISNSVPAPGSAVMLLGLGAAARRRRR